MPDQQQATPILDSGILPPIRRPNRIVGVLIGAGIGLLFAVIVQTFGRGLGSQPVVVLLFYFITLGLAVTVHEFGHLIAGWIVGFHFSLICLGPIMLGMEYGRFRIQIRSLGVGGYAGMHIETVKRARKKFLIFIAGGPFANFASGAIAMLFVHSNSSPFQNTWIRPFAAGFAVFSFVIGGSSLIPYGSTLPSDGTRLWMLLRSRERTRRWIATCALGSLQRKGVRPRNWRVTWLRAACLVRDGGSDELSSNLLAYLAASDRKDEAAATSHLERSLDLARRPNPTQRDFIAREACYFSAWFRGDMNLAERWLAQVHRTKAMTPLLQIRTEIALDCARHNFPDAITRWKAGRDFIQRLPDTKVKDLLQDSWQEWGEEILQKEQQTAIRV